MSAAFNNRGLPLVCGLLIGAWIMSLFNPPAKQKELISLIAKIDSMRVDMRNVSMQDSAERARLHYVIKVEDEIIKNLKH